MDNLRFRCDGLAVLGLWIPRFELGAGQSLCLHLASPLVWKELEEIAKLLCGKKPAPGIHLVGKGAWAAPAAEPIGLRRLLFRPKAIDWLSHASGLSRSEAIFAMERLGLKSSARLDELAWTPRTLLGLEAALAKGDGLVLFSTAGLDSLGTRQVFEMVTTRMESRAAIFLSFPFLCNKTLLRLCFPPGKCLEVCQGQGEPSPAGVFPITGSPGN